MPIITSFAILTVGRLWLSFITLPFLCNAYESSLSPINVCPTGDSICSDISQGSFHPNNLPIPTAFTDFDSNTTVDLPNGITYSIASGSVRQGNNISNNDVSASINFTMMENAVGRPALDEVLKLLRSSSDEFDVESDTVDGMPTYELYLDADDLDEPDSEVLDSDPIESPRFAELRSKIKSILDPYVDNVLTPYVRQTYPSACGREGRLCTPCTSLFRRYIHGERQSHDIHNDGEAIVTVVVSLSDYGIDFRGGLYVSAGYEQREFLGMRKGDAVIHQSSLRHGVKVYDLEEEPEKTERWSWILWYRDSDTCEDFSYEWFADCAAKGVAFCQHLHAEALDKNPRLSKRKVNRQRIIWNWRAAKGGYSLAAVTLAEAYQKNIPSSLPLDYNKSQQYYEMAVQSNCPSGHYGMADLILYFLSEKENSHQLTGNELQKYKQEQLTKVIYHLEAAARMYHVYAMFNLGIAHNYGYGVPRINSTLAAEWFAASGLPEGYYLSSQQARSMNDTEREQVHEKRAKKLGFFESWRQEERDELKLLWPVSIDGRKPPTF